MDIHCSPFHFRACEILRNWIDRDMNLAVSWTLSGWRVELESTTLYPKSNMWKGGIRVSYIVFELKMAVSEKRVWKGGIVVSNIVSEKGHVCIRKGPWVYPKCIRKATFMRQTTERSYFEGTARRVSEKAVRVSEKPRLRTMGEPLIPALVPGYSYRFLRWFRVRVSMRGTSLIF